MAVCLFKSETYFVLKCKGMFKLSNFGFKSLSEFELHTFHRTSYVYLCNILVQIFNAWLILFLLNLIKALAAEAKMCFSVNL